MNDRGEEKGRMDPCDAESSAGLWNCRNGIFIDFHGFWSCLNNRKGEMHDGFKQTIISF